VTADVPYHVMLRSGTTFIDVASGGLMETEADLRRLIATATAPPNASAAASDTTKRRPSLAEEAPFWHNFNMAPRGTKLDVGGWVRLRYSSIVSTPLYRCKPRRHIPASEHEPAQRVPEARPLRAGGARSPGPGAPPGARTVLFLIVCMLSHRFRAMRDLMQALLVAPTRHLHATRLQLLARFMLHDPLNYDEYYKRARADMAVLRDVLRRANTSNPATFSHIAVRARRLCSVGAFILTADTFVRPVPVQASYEDLLSRMTLVAEYHRKVGVERPPKVCARGGDRSTLVCLSHPGLSFSRACPFTEVPRTGRREHPDGGHGRAAHAGATARRDHWLAPRARHRRVGHAGRRVAGRGRRRDANLRDPLRQRHTGRAYFLVMPRPRHPTC